MKRAVVDVETLPPKTRLVIFHNTSVCATTALVMPEGDLDYNFFLANGVKAVNFVAAGVTTVQMQQRGFDTASKLRDFGFDALHLVNPSFCNSMLIVYGRDDLVKTFLVAPQDAVSLAGSQAVKLLKLSTRELLECCIGFPAHAFAVLKQLPNGSSLGGVPTSLLLDTGMRLKTLASLGYTVENIIKATNADSNALQKLGFFM